MNLHLMDIDTLAETTLAPTWIEADVLEAAQHFAELASVRGTLTLVGDRVHFEFLAQLRSTKTDECISVRYELPSVARGASTDRVHSVAEVLGELAFAASQDRSAAEGLRRLLGKHPAAVLTRLADDQDV